MNTFSNNKGSMMVEAMIAISIALVALLGVLSLLTQSLHINADVGQRFTATYLAAEGIEIVKNIIDANSTNAACAAGTAWNNGVGANGRGQYFLDYDSHVLQQGNDDLGNLCFDSHTGSYTHENCYKELRVALWRGVEISLIGDDEIAVNVVVKNEEKTLAVLEDHFFNWRKCPTPSQ